MTRIAELETYVRYAERLRHELPTLREGLPETLRPRLDQIATLADGVIRTAQGPVRIGVVGEFSSGKSLVLAALMGCADVLPVNEVPTTGNITSIRFSPLPEAGEGRPCLVDACRIAFLTRDEVLECRTHMVKVTQARLTAAGAPSELAQDLVAAAADDSGSSWQALEACCRAIWAATPNPEVRYLIRDLMNLTRAYTGLGRVLCGRRYSVPVAVAQAALALADAPPNLQHLGFAEMLPPPFELDREPAELDDATVRGGFHLIRGCELEVRIAPRFWDLSALKGRNEFVLLDFPGLGAAGSSVRDEYLCRREMRDVQTILLLINGHRPGSGEAARLFSMMQEGRGTVRDAILVGIGRFDQLPLQDDEPERLRRLAEAAPAPAPLAADDGFFGNPAAGGSVFDALAAAEAAAPERLTEQQLRTQVRALHAVLADAASLSSDANRTVLLSPVIYLGELHRRWPGAAPAAAGLTAELERQFERAQPLRALWRALADRLRHGGAAGPVTEWLDAFAADGGVRRLRQLLGAHVTEHGVRQLSADVIRQTEQLGTALKQLLQLLPEEAAASRPAADRGALVTRGLLQLKRAYRELKDDLNNDPPDLMIDLPGGTLPLVEHIREEVEDQVYAWPHWRNLFVLIRDEDSLVDLAKGRTASELFRAADTPDELPLAQVPLCGADLKAPFEETYARLQQQVHRLAEQAVEAWLDRLAERLAPARDTLREFFDEAAAARVAAAQSQPRRTAFENLRKALDPRRLKQGLVALAFKGAAAEAGPATACFPLRAGRRFGWDPDLGRLDPPVPKASRHHSRVLRIRTELAASLSRQLKEQVSLINQLAARALLQASDHIATSIIEDCLADPELLRLLADTPPPESGGETPAGPRERLAALCEARPEVA